MTPSLATQCYREGFARGIIKKALFEKAWGAPARAELEALGQRLFTQANAPGTGMLKRLVSSSLPAYGQTQQVTHALMSRPMTDPVVRDLFHQIGETAHGKMQFYGKQLPIGAAAVAAGGAGLHLGRRAGAQAQGRFDQQTVDNMPIWDRLRYAVLPHSLNL
jgi:hypothetical protein